MTTKRIAGLISGMLAIGALAAMGEWKLAAQEKADYKRAVDLTAQEFLKFDSASTANQLKWMPTTPTEYAIAAVGPTSFTFMDHGKLVVEIKTDGTVKLGEGVTIDVAAKRFYEGVALMFKMNAACVEAKAKEQKQ